MTGNEAKKKLAMMRSGVFRQLAMEIVIYLHEVQMLEPPVEVEEYARVTEEVIRALSSRLQPVVKKKEKVRQKDLLEEIEDWKSDQYIAEPGDVFDYIDPLYEKWKLAHPIKLQTDGE